MTATLTKWHEEHGRHQICTGGKKVQLSSTEHNRVLDPEAVAKGRRTSTSSGIAKNAREEKRRAKHDELLSYARDCSIASRRMPTRAWRQACRPIC